MTVAFPRRDLGTELSDHTGGFRQRFQLTALRERAAERFFGVKMDAAAHHLAHYLAMPVVGGGDHHGIGSLLVEHFPPILVKIGFGELRPELVEHQHVHIAERRHVDAAMGGKRLEIGRPLRTAADHREFKP